MTRDHRRVHVWVWIAVSLLVGLASVFWFVAQGRGAS